jgi:hypothetical protein
MIDMFNEDLIRYPIPDFLKGKCTPTVYSKWLERNLLWVRQGKGKKDRAVMLGSSLKENIKSYQQMYHPTTHQHKKEGGWPEGGSLEFARSIEKRFLGLGGLPVSHNSTWAPNSTTRFGGIRKKLVAFCEL